MSGIPEIKSEYSPTFKRINVNGIFGGVRPSGVEAVIYSEHNDIEKVLETQPLSANRTIVKRIIECELIIDPMQMKSFHKWLTDKIKDYEELIGPIPSPEEVQSRQKRHKGKSPSE